MSKEEAIKTLLADTGPENIEERLERIEKKFDLILSVIVVQQKDVCAAKNISPDTVRNKVLSGDTEVLQADGSRLNFMTLKTAGELKPRRNRKRK